MCLLISGFPTGILCVIVIAAVRFSCPICPTVFQFTTHQHSETSTNHAVSLVPSAPLPFSSPPTNIQWPVQIMKFLLSHLAHCLSVHHPPTFSDQYKSCSISCPICPTVFQSTTHQHSLTSTNHAVSLVPSATLSFKSPLTKIQWPVKNHAVSLVPSVPLSFSSPPTNIQWPVQIMQFVLPICHTVFQFTTHQHSVTSTNHAVSLVPSVPLSFSSPPTNVQSPL
jgi:hypothetical protein